MQTGYILCFLIFPISLEGCCVGNQQKKRTGISFKHKLYFNITAEKLCFLMCECVEKEACIYYGNDIPDLFRLYN